MGLLGTAKLPMCKRHNVQIICYYLQLMWPGYSLNDGHQIAKGMAGSDRAQAASPSCSGHAFQVRAGRRESCERCCRPTAN
jgi:hypothetical protein